MNNVKWIMGIETSAPAIHCALYIVHFTLVK